MELTLTYNLTHAKETKGTHQYRGENQYGRPVTFYVQKDDMRDLGVGRDVPQEITLTVAWDVPDGTNG